MSVYNGETYLQESISSILQQQYSDFEFIIINDGSTDSSLDIIQKNAKEDSRIRVINRENKGLIFSLNEGCGLARGTYIARMDADDISLPSRLLKQVQFMNTHHEIGVCGTYIESFNSKCSNTNKFPCTVEKCFVTLLFSPPVAHPSVMFRTRSIKQYNLFYSENYKFCEDYELWSRWIKFEKIVNIPEILLRYRVHQNQISEVNEKELLKNHYKVSAQLLKKLGIEFTPKQIRIFLLKKPDADNLQDLLALYNKVQKSNQKNPIFNSHDLEKLLTHKVETAVLKIYGIKSLPTYFQSQYFKIYNTNSYYFLARILYQQIKSIIKK